MLWVGSYLGVLARILGPHEDHAEAIHQIQREPNIH